MTAELPSDRIGFRQLRLRPRTLLQLSRPGDAAMAQDWQFAAAMEGRGLMLAPMSNQPLPALVDNADYHVQGFTGQYDFRFATRLLNVFDVPFAYALFAWPDEVSGRLVRQALRVRTLLPARVFPGPAPHGEGQVAAILDLSASGALLEVTAPIGGIGESAFLSFRVEAEGEAQQINIACAICHRREVHGTPRERIGLGFRSLPKPERLMLSLYLHTLANEPDTV